MKILLLTEVYPPEPVVGSFRAQKVARALAAAGHEVLVVTSLSGAPSTVPSLEPPGVTVLTAKPWRSPIHLAAALRKSLTGARSRPTDTQPGGPPTTVPGGTRKSRGLLVDLMSVPDESQGLIPPMLQAVSSRQGSHFDLMYSTSPSHSVHLVAWWISRRRGLPWIAEFRDPWTDNPEILLSAQGTLAQRVNAALERMVFRRASAVVAVTDEAGALFRRKLPEGERKKVVVAFNGIARVEAGRPERVPSDPLRLVYAGSIYPPRTAVPFLESLARLRSAGFTAPVELTFVGDCRMYDGMNVEDRCRELGLGDVVRFLDWVPQQVAQQMVNGADLLLLPAQQWVHQIPNKAFDYLGSRVPVLAICEPGSELGKLLREVGGHSIVEEIAGLDAAMLQCLNAARGARYAVGDEERLSVLTVEEQMRRVVNLVQAVGAA